MSVHKPVHTIVLDAGPILKNDPSISTLLAKSEQLFTVSAVISEIKDINARSRTETTFLPFLTIKDPDTRSIEVVTDFARKTGDLVVLSKADVLVLALTYELECEKNGGDWRLRRNPGQKGINGPVPPKSEASPIETSADERVTYSNPDPGAVEDSTPTEPETIPTAVPLEDDSQIDHLAASSEAVHITDPDYGSNDGHEAEESTSTARADDATGISDPESSGSEGWITPSNLKKKQARDMDPSSIAISKDKTMQVATITADFAMQNVLLQMGLNLLSPSIQQVRHIKTYILRCHACFEKTRDMTKQFCPRCGKPTLTRVSCSTNAKGEFHVHLKKNMQWNHRGDRFSIPKPVSGAANGKSGQGKGGGKGGWGQELILAEDQKEYVRAMSGQSRRKEKNLMDEDYLPSILTGDRGRAGGRPKVGAGRNVNSKKR